MPFSSSDVEGFPVFDFEAAIAANFELRDFSSFLEDLEVPFLSFESGFLPLNRL